MKNMGKVRKTDKGFEVVHTYGTRAEVDEHMANDAAERKEEANEPMEERQAENDPMHEHDTLRSRTTGRVLEIGMPPQGGGLVPSNPFASLAQAGYLHSHPEILGKSKLAEFDAATKGRHLPKKVKK